MHSPIHRGKQNPTKIMYRQKSLLLVANEKGENVYDKYIYIFKYDPKLAASLES